MKSFVSQDLASNGDYIKLLSAVSKLSGLFSESSIPYINYRVAENIFCRSFHADNLSRSDTAFDARLGTLGIGLKTFICSKDSSIEKIAEFNALSAQLSKYKELALAKELSESRNKRIELAKELYGLDAGVYHIVARRAEELLLFETDYEPIDIDNLTLLGGSEKTLKFFDGHNEYSYNYSKSTLYRRFVIPEEVSRYPIKILKDPYEILLNLISKEDSGNFRSKIAGEDYVILPLYSTQSKSKEVPEKSGLNQWNAGGRTRDFGEIYIPVPVIIHKKFPNFFPKRDETFVLKTPTNDNFSAKLCQDGAKALMTNPNNALSNWLLRGLFKLKEGELLTRQKQEILGVDSIIIYKEKDFYKIDVEPFGAYEQFKEQILSGNT